MKRQTRSVLTGTILLAMLAGTSTVHAQDTTEPIKQVESLSTWADIRDEDRISGRLTFFGQPTKEEIKAFADSGGRVVINARTVGEMDKLDFNEQEYVESLGMEYVHIPTNSSTFGYAMRDQLADA